MKLLDTALLVVRLTYAYNSCWMQLCVMTVPSQSHMTTCLCLCHPSCGLPRHYVFDLSVRVYVYTVNACVCVPGGVSPTGLSTSSLSLLDFNIFVTGFASPNCT